MTVLTITRSSTRTSCVKGPRDRLMYNLTFSLRPSHLLTTMLHFCIMIIHNTKMYYVLCSIMSCPKKKNIKGLVWLPTQTKLTDICVSFCVCFSQHPQRNLQSSEGSAAGSASAEPQGPPGLRYAHSYIYTSIA